MITVRPNSPLPAAPPWHTFPPPHRPPPWEYQARILELRHALETVIVGQAKLLDRLVIGLLAGGHVLVEGLPGLAKTTTVKTLAGGVHARFRRIQFTPDLLPGDLTGTDIHDPRESHFHFAEGPLFNEIILADELNRAPTLSTWRERHALSGGWPGGVDRFAGSRRLWQQSCRD